MTRPGRDRAEDRSVLPSLSQSIESRQQGDMLRRLEGDLRGLDPQDGMHQRLEITVLNQYELLMHMRWKLIEEAHSSISEPFFLFASFGLSAPRNLLSYTTIFLGAPSIASVIYVILDLDTPFSGAFLASSRPMRDALTEMSR
jgi:hypothetical protein